VPDPTTTDPFAPPPGAVMWRVHIGGEVCRAGTDCEVLDHSVVGAGPWRMLDRTGLPADAPLVPGPPGDPDVTDPAEALPTWWACCPHCGCPTQQRTGHDDTCARGCNDPHPTGAAHHEDQP
jgi:hypothetical protein